MHMLKHVILYTALFLVLSAHSAYAWFDTPESLLKEQRDLIAAVDANPDNPEYRFNLSMNLAYTGWIEIAWKQLKKVNDLDPNYKDIVFDTYKPLVLSEPDQWQHHFKLAFAFYVDKQKDQTMKHFKMAQTLAPDNPWIMGFIALLYGEQKNYKECIAWCKRAIKLAPDGVALHFLLAKAYLESGDMFGFIGESVHVGRLKSIEAKYRPQVPE